MMAYQDTEPQALADLFYGSRQRSENEQTALQKELLNFLLFRASTQQRSELIGGGVLSVGLFTGKSRGLLQLWLELYSRNTAVDLLELEGQIKLRRLSLNVQELTLGDFSCRSTEDCRTAAQRLAQVNAQIGVLNLIENQIEALGAGKDLSFSLVSDIEKVFADNGQAKAETAADLLAALASLRTEEQNQDKFYVKSGFKIFDRLFGGFRRGDLSVICARPGEGKSLIAGVIALQHLAVTAHDPEPGRVLYISCEMPHNQLLRRLVVANDNPQPPNFDPSLPRQAARLTFAEIAQRSAFSDELYANACRNLVPLLDGRFKIIDQDPLSIDELENLIAQYSVTFKPTLIIIDYWQLLQGGKGRDQRERLASNSQRLKSMSRRTNSAVLCLAQLRRQNMQGDEIIHPDLTSIAESDQIGRDAALVMALSRFKAADAGGAPYEFTGLEVIKNRHGARGLIQMRMCGSVGRIYEIAQAEDWPKQYREPKTIPANGKYGAGGQPLKITPTIKPLTTYGAGHDMGAQDAG